MGTELRGLLPKVIMQLAGIFMTNETTFTLLRTTDALH